MIAEAYGKMTTRAGAIVQRCSNKYCHRGIMRLIIIRHAIAEDRETFARTGRPDALRPLTKEGRRKMHRVARGLRRLEPNLPLLATSPLTRAMQTAKIVARRYKNLKPVQIAPLSPRKPLPLLLEWLQKNAAQDCIALVGHEPHLSTFIGWMLTGLKESFITFKKGGVLAIDFESEIKPGRGKLLWSLKPSQLRDLQD